MNPAVMFKLPSLKRVCNFASSVEKGKIVMR